MPLASPRPAPDRRRLAPRAARARCALALAIALAPASARADEETPPPEASPSSPASPPRLALPPALALRGESLLALDAATLRALPLARPDVLGGPARGFEAALVLAPGARLDPFGVAFAGATSPENAYRVDGLDVADPALGVLGARAPVPLLRAARVTTAGFLPEHGRVGAALVEAETQPGGDVLRGSVAGGITPGLFASPRGLARSPGSTLATGSGVASIEDVAGEVGGPILPGRLFFHAGLVGSITRLHVDRTIDRLRLDPSSGEALDDGGLVASTSGHPPTRELLPSTLATRAASERAIAWAGRLDAVPAPSHLVTLSAFGAVTDAGGRGDVAIDPLRGAPESQGVAGAYGAIATRRPTLASDLALRWRATFDDARRDVDASVGWHHARRATLPSDGSAIGDASGLAAAPQVVWRRRPARGIDELEPVPGGGCARVRGLGPSGRTFDATPCPVDEYRTGGPGHLEDATLDRVAASASLGAIVALLGHHELRIGGDVALAAYDHVEAYSGGAALRESATGSSFVDARALGALAAPDTPRLAPSVEATSSSVVGGAFVQDRWAIADVVTLEGGVRWDGQALTGADRQVGLALPATFSPRVGVVFDPSQRGRARLRAHYARLVETLPLDLADRALPGRARVSSAHTAASAGGLCDPRTDAGASRCLDAASPRAPSTLPGDPSAAWSPSGGARLPVDPDLRAQATDEVLVGADVALPIGARLGVSWQRRWLVDAIGVMSRDDGRSYFVGNPGSGLGADFEPARRDWDAVTVELARPLDGRFLVRASYTASWLRGNYAGLYRPETGALTPNTSPDFDLRSLQANRDGPLPGDRRHALALHAAALVDLPAHLFATIGVGWRSRSGEPTSVLGAHPIYGADAVYVLPRGAGERLPWVHDLDAHLGLGADLGRDVRLEIEVDVWNVLDFAAPIAVDERFTSAAVLPVPSGTTADIPLAPTDRSPGRLRNADGTPFSPRDMNPGFGRATAWQAPRLVRLGARVSW